MRHPHGRRCAPGLVQSLEPRLLFAATSFTIDPARSSIAISASLTALHLGIKSQSADGSGLMTSYEGTVAADLAAGQITFTGGSHIAAQVSGVFQPGDPPGTGSDPGSGPADYGGKATIPFQGTELVAARNLVFDVLSGPLPLASDGTFDSAGQTVTALQGTVDASGIRTAAVDLSGQQSGNPSQSPSKLTISGNLATLTLPINVDLPFTALSPDDSHLILKGQIVATAQLTPPAVTAASFNFLTTPQTLSFTFSSDVSQSLSLSSLSVQNLTSGQTPQPASLAYDPSTNTATFAFAGVVPDGRYIAILSAAQVTDAFGQPLGGGTDYPFSFFFLQGDVNHDGSVGFADLLALAQHYGQPGTFAQGDLNYDGQVDFADLLLLAQRYGRRLSSSTLEASAARRVVG